MKEINIVKIGGNVIDNPNELKSFLKIFADLKGLKILVHGGGKKASQWAERLNIPVQLIDGRRITDSDTLELITGIYAGQINKNIVASLQGLNCNAVGLSGADGNAIRAVKRTHKNIDYGWVGDIVDVNTDFFKSLLSQNIIPVCCALTHDGKGQLLNTNADTIASSIAIALGKEYRVTLHYCFEQLGVMRSLENPDSLIEHIDSKLYSELLNQKIISDGMLVKMENVYNALKKGVNKVTIGKAEMISGNTKHTSITL